MSKLKIKLINGSVVNWQQQEHIRNDIHTCQTVKRSVLYFYLCRNDATA